MFKHLSNLANLVQTASRLGDRLTELKHQMHGKRVRGRACHGDHEVVVELNGLGVVQTVELSESLFQDPSHKSLAQRLILESMNQAVSAAKELHVHAIKELTQGVDVPGLDKLIEELAS
ncbi:MAG: YbaB/EbfC family nucleoid-associated protein [Planctomycetota bacterium]|jgi:DNA-binding protein YbaB